MGNSGLRLCVLATLMSIALMCVGEEPKPMSGRLSLPAKDWGVVLNLPGFAEVCRNQTGRSSLHGCGERDNERGRFADVGGGQVRRPGEFVSRLAQE